MERSRTWTITVNNYTAKDLILALSLELESAYLILAHEHVTTPHIQGYVYFKNARTLSSVKKSIPRAHWEIAKGSPTQNRNYCIKDGDFIEFGKLPAQGSRSDLEDIKTEIKNGTSLETIADNNFSKWCIYRRAFSEYQDMLRSKNNETDIALYKGDDIDQYILNNYDPGDVYFADQYNDWRGYHHQSIIVITHHYIDIPFIRRLVMGFPVEGKIPYGTIKLNPKLIIIDGTETWKQLKLKGENLSVEILK